MNPWFIPPIVAAGISFSVAHYHLVVYAQRRLHRADLFFSLTCYAICGYDLLCAGLYRATSVIEATAWLRGQLIAASLFTTTLLWFVEEYAGRRRLGVRVAASLVSLAAIVIQAVDRSPLTLIVDPAAVKRIVLPIGLDVTYLEPGAGPISIVQVAIALAILGYSLWTVVSSPRPPRRSVGWPLPLALSVFSAAMLNDAAVFLGLYPFLYLAEYAYLVLIMLMSIALSRAAVSADVDGDRFRTLVENSSTGIFVVDDRYRFHYLNDEASRILGRPRGELLGTDFRELLDGRWRNLVADRYPAPSARRVSATR
jgi:PAS domain-containing protein